MKLSTDNGPIIVIHFLSYGRTYLAKYVFSARYTVLHIRNDVMFSASCDDVELTAYTSPQTLTSPGYPNNYENNLYCVWWITTFSPGYYITVQIDVMDLEVGYDRLIIQSQGAYNGRSCLQQ